MSQLVQSRQGTRSRRRSLARSVSLLPLRHSQADDRAGSCLHAIKALKHPRWEDYEYTSASPQNARMGWLGSGWTRAEMDQERESQSDRAPYLGEIDVPAVPQ